MSRSVKSNSSSRSRGALSNISEHCLDEDELFMKICQIRESFSIPKLIKNKDLKTVCCDITKTGKVTPIIETGLNYTIISVYSVIDTFNNESVDQIIHRWLSDSNKRPVIISPGNYGAIHVEYNNDQKTSGKIALIVALIYRPKTQK